MQHRDGWFFAGSCLRAASWVPVIAMIAVGFSLMASGVSAQELRDDFWVTNGYVYDMATSPSGDILYIGGSFSQVCPATGQGVPIGAATGLPVEPFPMVTGGDVYTAAPDGQGGWYIGGSFTAVAGIPRSCLAHVSADGSLSAWDPAPDGSVYTLLVSGSLVYIGGNFSVVGGVVRRFLAALDATSGAPTTWNPNPDLRVHAIAVDGPIIYVGGEFTYMHSLERHRIAALDAATGAATPWDPSADDCVRALAVNGSTVYAGGEFFHIGVQYRSKIAAIDAATGTATAWNPDANGTVRTMVADGSLVYAGGEFTRIGGQARSRIAALDAGSGLATSWNPGAASAVYSMLLNGATLYAGGGFRSIGGQSRTYLAALDAVTGAATAWDPRPNSYVRVVAAAGSTVYAGGGFTGLGGETRNSIAALDAVTGIVTAWDPDARGNVNDCGGTVHTLAVSGSVVYAGGCFETIGSYTRNHIAAIDAATGVPTEWNPDADDAVEALVMDASTLYVAGDFTSIGGQSRHRIAALDVGTGAATAWNPGVGGQVYVLALDESTVYAGGAFTNIGGAARAQIAALDRSTGLATAWDPHATGGGVFAMALAPPVIYVGGTFTSVGGQARNRIAALELSTGNATSWDPDAYPSVLDLDVEESVVYAGGSFTSIGGQTRHRIAAVDAVTGFATAWDPSADDEVRCIEAREAAVYAGGDFRYVGSLPQTGIVAFGSVSVPTCEISPSTLDFGTILVDTFQDRSFVIRNTGPWDSYALVGDIQGSCPAYAILEGGGPFSLVSGDSLVVTVRFSPLVDGSQSCTIESGAALCGDVECIGVGSYFTEVSPGLPGVMSGTVDWGDYDNDQDLDILLAGDTSGEAISGVYRNDSGVFTDISAGLPGVSDCSGKWGDYDGDGDLDILLAGYTDGTPSRVANIYRNDNGVFTDIAAGLTAVSSCDVAWGDYDNDGDLDILLAGAVNYITRVFRNDAGVFTDINASLTDVASASVEWGDYDNDGDLDILLAGTSSGPALVSLVYRNDGAGFTDISAGLPGVRNGRAAWGDFDNDGDLDILLAGDAGSDLGRISRIYRDEGGVFSDIGAGLSGVGHMGSCAAAWGDYDNDGDLDVFLAGRGSPSDPEKSILYRNDEGVFTDVEAEFVPVRSCQAVWGDDDNDGDLDLLVIGYTGSAYSTRFYRNQSPVANTVPTPPGNLSAEMDRNEVTFHWDAAADAQTETAGLTYNLYLGTTPGGSQLMPAMSNAATGYRRVVRLGNVNHNTAWRVTLPGSGTYYWSVQAEDAGFAGSPFAAEQVLEADIPAVCDVVPAVLDFGDVRVGQIAERSFVIRNSGGSPLLGTVSESCDAYSIISGGGAFSLSADESVAVTVRFTPPAVGAYPCVIETGADLCSDVECAGNGVTDFTEIDPGLTDVESSATAWGDYDNDGDLDLFLMGHTGLTRITSIYRNDAGAFTDIGASLTGAEDGEGAWGDYDGDGDLDILQVGSSGGHICNNDAGVFTDIEAGLPERCSDAAWGDYDNDGDLDILLQGYAETVAITVVYRNDGGVFVESDASLPGSELGDVAWGDYDNDGDLDILLTGYTTAIYCNTGGMFADIGAGLPIVIASSCAWGDYDNDGDLDVVLSGTESGGGRISRIYRNTDGLFQFVAGLAGLWMGSVGWGDYDNDGDLDILLTGWGSPNCYTYVYRNNNGVFVNSGSSFIGVAEGDADWGDYDNDGDLDFVESGVRAFGRGRICTLYRNNAGVANTPPSAPANLSAEMVRGAATFHWDAPEDAETPAAGLTYNLCVGTTSGGAQVVPGMASAATGYRRVVELGNANENVDWTVALAGPGAYFWSVQALDAAFAGSLFADEQLLLWTTSVQVVGDFNDWDENAPDMTPLAPGVWIDTLEVAAGCHLLKFRTNHDGNSDYGTCTGEDPSCLVPMAGATCIVSGEATALGYIDFADTGYYQFSLDENASTYLIEYMGSSAAEPLAIPTVLRFYAGSPNPFSGSANLAYDLPSRTRVTIRIHDLSGRLVRVVEDAERDPGRYAVAWDGKDVTGNAVASGVYLFRMRAGDVVKEQRLVLLR